MRAYKVFENDWTCKGFKFEFGIKYKINGDLIYCANGFHACKKLEDCFNYYPLIQWNRYAIVEQSGKIIERSNDSKVCSQEIELIEEIKFNDIPTFMSKGINRSEGINWSEGINRSEGINGSKGINRSEGINWSKGINLSKGINNCFGVQKSRGVNNGLFIFNKAEEHTLFNKKVSDNYFNQIKGELHELLNGWCPTFNNLKILYLKSGSKWEQTPICNAEEIQKKDAWKGMPKKAINYLKSLPEFDKNIFKEITGIDVKVD